MVGKSELFQFFLQQCGDRRVPFVGRMRAIFIDQTVKVEIHAVVYFVELRMDVQKVERARIVLQIPM